MIAERDKRVVANALHWIAVHVQQHLPYKVAPAVIDLRWSATTIRAHADKSKGVEHVCKYQSYHLHGLLLSILQN